MQDEEMISIVLLFSLLLFKIHQNSKVSQYYDLEMMMR